MFWAPSMLQRVSQAVTGVLTFGSSLTHLRAECVPRIFKEQFLLLIQSWSQMFHSGVLQQYYWSFHYHSFSFLLDHPARQVEADLAYMASVLEGAIKMLAIDLSESRDTVAFFLESSQMSEEQIAGIALQELESFGDNIDGEGRFTPYELLYRELFDKWWLDKGLSKEVVRLLVAENAEHIPTAIAEGKPIVSIIDLGAGGGHYSEFFNNTGLLSAHAYDAPVNLLPMEFNMDDAVRRYTGEKVNFFDVSEVIKHRGLPARRDYVFCVEVAEHLPRGARALFFANLEYLGKKGMILSWAEEELCGLGWGHQNCLEKGTTLKDEVEKYTGYVLDEQITKKLKETADVSWIKRGVSFFRRKTVVDEVEAWISYQATIDKIQMSSEAVPKKSPKFESKTYVKNIVSAPLLYGEETVRSHMETDFKLKTRTNIPTTTTASTTTVVAVKPTMPFQMGWQLNAAAKPSTPFQMGGQLNAGAGVGMMAGQLPGHMSPVISFPSGEAFSEGNFPTPAALPRPSDTGKTHEISGGLIAEAVAVIDKQIVEKINNRPKGEKPVDFLNYEKVLEDVRLPSVLTALL